MLDFDPYLNREITKSLGDRLLVVTDEALGMAGWVREDVEVFIPQQTCAWMPTYLSEHLGFSDEATYHTFEEYANVNGPGITASWHEARRAGRIDDGSKVLVAAAGAGYTYAASAIQW